MLKLSLPQQLNLKLMPTMDMGVMADTVDMVDTVERGKLYLKQKHSLSLTLPLLLYLKPKLIPTSMMNILMDTVDIHSDIQNIFCDRSGYNGKLAGYFGLILHF